jgi:hypothetical protein
MQSVSLLASSDATFYIELVGDGTYLDSDFLRSPNREVNHGVKADSALSPRVGSVHRVCRWAGKY